MADEGYEKVCRVRSLLAECMGPPRESKFLNMDRYMEDEDKELIVPDAPRWSTASFRGFQERVLTYRPQHWGADPSAVLWFSKYGWRCTGKFVIKCDVCFSSVECSSLIQKPDLWGDLAHKAHDDLCYWSFCPCPDRFIQIITHPRALCKNVRHDWRKIVAYGSELPRIQETLLDKMGLTRNILKHLFEIVESSYSDEGVTALVLFICGWLNSPEDKILECAYCQRHLALRHFWSLADDSAVNESLQNQEDLSSRNEVSRAEHPDTTTPQNISMETFDDSSLATAGDQTKFDCTIKQRKRTGKCYPAIHNSTAIHRASALACVTKQKFPSYCNILHLRYGIDPTKTRKAFKLTKIFRKTQSEETQRIEDKPLSNKNDFNDEKASLGLYNIEMEITNQNSSEVIEKAINNEMISVDPIRGSDDNGAHPNKDAEDVEPPLVAELDTAIEETCEMRDNSIFNRVSEDTVTVTNKDGNSEEIALAESISTCVDTEMVEISTAVTNSQNQILESKMTEDNLAIDNQKQATEENTNGESSALKTSVLSDSDSNQSGCNTQSNEMSHMEQVEAGSSCENNENAVEGPIVSIPFVTGKPEIDNEAIDFLPTGKRHLSSDEDQQTYPAKKKMKNATENLQLKKKDLNPINEHRFWCIWRVKTVDRLLGSAKEGWRQILDLLKYGVEPENSEGEEVHADIFEHVKQVHYLMNDW